MSEVKLLEGIKVVDASLAETGPCATQFLAFLGADVYHIERPKAMEFKRILNYTGVLQRNCNKKSISVNSKTQEGKELMWKLLEKADVFLENFAPGAWDRMGFSYEEVKKRNPNILYVSVKGFSKESPWANCVTIDPVACCTGGSAYLGGYEDFDVPMLTGINTADGGTGIHAGLTLLFAILRRKLTGKGEFIEVPMQNVVTTYCRDAFVEYYAKDGKIRRSGNGYKGLKKTGPWNIYPTLGHEPMGNFIAITCRPEAEYQDFEHLCAAMGRTDLLEDPRYLTPELRYENRLSLDKEIRKWTFRFSKEKLMDVLGKQWGIPVGMVNSIKDILADDFLNNGSGVVQAIEDPLMGKPFYTPSIPIKISGEPTITLVSCGEEGTANEEVYGGFLGLSKEEIADLTAKHVI